MSVIGMRVITPACIVCPITKVDGTEDYQHYRVRFDDVGEVTYAASELRPLTYYEQFSTSRHDNRYGYAARNAVDALLASFAPTAPKR